jgi:glutaredoxin
VEEFLSQKGVSYTTRDVAADEDALRDLEELGYLTTPVTVIHGQVVVGFDRKKLDALLAERYRSRQ